jgi:hypothetical protein
MKRLGSALMRVLVLAYLLLGSPVFLFAGEKAQPLNFIADTTGLSGMELWYADLYNSNKLYCALVTIIVIPVVGFILGSIADFLISKTGLDLKSRAK